MIPLTLICLALIAFSLYRERQFDAERKRVQAERDKLLTRIQAPAIASVPEIDASRVPYIPFDDDEAFAANQEEMNGAG